MDFSSFVKDSYKFDQNTIAPNTKKSYQSCLNSYAKFMDKIPSAPPPFPLTDEKVRGFLNFKINLILFYIYFILLMNKSSSLKIISSFYIFYKKSDRLNIFWYCVTGVKNQ